MILVLPFLCPRQHLGKLYVTSRLLLSWGKQPNLLYILIDQEEAHYWLPLFAF